jgi:CDP-paratose 2-epimerase
MRETILLTGGCGFVGSNLAKRFLDQGLKVRIIDNLSRPGSEVNREWLASLGYGSGLEFVQGDVCNTELVRDIVKDIGIIFHLAAQVAVTTSIKQPRADLEINILGTLNVLEAARQAARPPCVVFTSTNKVYGQTADISIIEQFTRYNYADQRFGIAEDQPLDFYSPYGCSKGSADQYVRDYGRIYGVPTVVLRMSCIYGPHQFGNEDQGWVAHLLKRALEQKQIVIYGDGKQVRDILYISDLLDLFELILQNQSASAGQVFNVGGGKNNTISIWREFGLLIGHLLERPIEVRYDTWRPGDQKVYVSDIRKAQQLLGWSPKVGVEDGVRYLLEWLKEQQPITIAPLEAELKMVGQLL